MGVHSRQYASQLLTGRWIEKPENILEFEGNSLSTGQKNQKEGNERK